MKKPIIVLFVLSMVTGLRATEKILGSSGNTGRWVKVARIQNKNPMDGGECSSISGTLNVQTDYGQSGSQQYYAIFSFGSRGGIKPLLQEFGDAANRPVTDLSRIEWRIYTDSQGWHYLWFWQSNYSLYAKFDFQTSCATQYWTFENPPINFVQVWSSLTGERQQAASATSRLNIKNPQGGLGLIMERGGKAWNFSIQNTGNNLFLNNSSNASTFFTYTNTGRFGIGTTSPDSELSVNGDIHAKEVKVDLIGWPDYVFFKKHKLPTLEEVEKHIQEKGHLINIPSAKEVEQNGIRLGEMNMKLLEKIEELTLYLIDQQKQIEQLKKMKCYSTPNFKK